jgi:uncharacterized protein
MIWSQKLLDAVRAQYQCDWEGHHGVWHWENVHHNGRELANAARKNGVRSDGNVIHLFALFHDACRVNEHEDPQHGLRGANLAMKLFHKGLFEASDAQLRLLHFACSAHADGATHMNPTIGICWDADRLDLPRVGITPRSGLLSQPTDPATLNRSEERALALAARVQKEKV